MRYFQFILISNTIDKFFNIQTINSSLKILIVPRGNTLYDK
jgi:hypothetical protein